MQIKEVDQLVYLSFRKREVPGARPSITRRGNFCSESAEVPSRDQARRPVLWVDPQAANTRCCPTVLLSYSPALLADSVVLHLVAYTPPVANFPDGALRQVVKRLRGELKRSAEKREQEVVSRMDAVEEAKKFREHAEELEIRVKEAAHVAERRLKETKCLEGKVSKARLEAATAEAKPGNVETRLKKEQLKLKFLDSDATELKNQVKSQAEATKSAKARRLDAREPKLTNKLEQQLSNALAKIEVLSEQASTATSHRPKRPKSHTAEELRR
eukprot:6196835-Pleurochrysis_carterae.AAC.2